MKQIKHGDVSKEKNFTGNIHLSIRIHSVSLSSIFLQMLYIYRDTMIHGGVNKIYFHIYIYIRRTDENLV